MDVYKVLTHATSCFGIMTSRERRMSCFCSWRVSLYAMEESRLLERNSNSDPTDAPLSHFPESLWTITSI